MSESHPVEDVELADLVAAEKICCLLPGPHRQPCWHCRKVAGELQRAREEGREEVHAAWQADGQKLEQELREEYAGSAARLHMAQTYIAARLELYRERGWSFGDKQGMEDLWGILR